MHKGGIRPKAIMPDPSIAAIDKSEVWITALTEFRNSSGAADPKATSVTAATKLYDEF
jgi:hypothetical protein